MYPSKYVAVEDLRGRDINVTISRVVPEKLKTNDGKTKKAWLIYFEKADKPLICNVTNARTIARLYGTEAEQWIGKRITLYPTTCEAFGQTTTCIRIRDRAPGESAPEPAELDSVDGEAFGREMADRMDENQSEVT